MTTPSLPPTVRTQLVLTWAQRGEVIPVLGVGMEPYMVYKRCERENPGYYCVTCKKHLRSVGYLEMHLENGGTHHVAVQCPKHGYENGARPKSFQLEIPT